VSNFIQTALPIDLKTGDRVQFGKWSGTKVKMDDVAAIRRAFLLGERLGHVLVLKLIIKATEGERSSIDLSEHDVERTQNGGDVGQHVAAA
jgi:hypothetical protein